MTNTLRVIPILPIDKQATSIRGSTNCPCIAVGAEKEPTLHNQEFGFSPGTIPSSSLLSAAERRCQELFAAMPVACLVTDPQGIILACNPKFESVYGWSRAKIIGRTLWETVGQASNQVRDLEQLNQIFSGAALDGIESIHHRSDGSLCRVLSNRFPLRDVQDVIIGCVSVDIVADSICENSEQDQEKLLRTVIANAPAIQYALDKDGIFTVSEGRGLEILGLRPGQLVGQSVYEVYQDSPDVLYSLRLAYAGLGQVFVTRVGDLTFEAHYTPIRDAENHIVGLVGVATDVTERTQIETALHNSEARKAAMLESALDCIITIDHQEKILEWNPAAEQTFGYRSEEVVGRLLSEVIIPSEYRNAHRIGIEHYLDTGNGPALGKRIEVMALRADGTEIPVELTAIPIHISNPPIFTAFLRDISHRRNAEIQQREKSERLQALTEELANANAALQTKMHEQEQANQIRRIAEQKYRNIFDNAIEGIFQATSNGSYVTANPAVARIFGFDSVDEMLSLPDIWPKIYVEPGRHAAFMEQVRAQGVVTDFESQIHRQDGSTLWISETVRTVYNQTGQLLYFEGTIQDITARKRAEQEIRALNAHLERRWQRIHAMREIDLAINSNLDLDFTLDVFLHHVSAQLGVDRADVLLHTPHKQERSRKSNVKKTGQHYSVPLLAKGQVRGVLEVSRTSEEPPDSEWVDFLESMAGHAAIAIDNAALFEDLQRSNLELTQAYDATIEGWSRALDLRDKETEGHTLRVVEMTLTLARELGISEDSLVQIRRGALLHDIGKMGIPDSILLKPGPLTTDEWIVMRMHPTYAYEMLKPIAFLRSALDIPYCHHERWDGTGYPQGLYGTDIPLVARIFAVVDVWDALRSDRPYRRGWPEERVLAHIQSLSGTHFDPKVVEVFLQLRGQQQFSQV